MLTYKTPNKGISFEVPFLFEEESAAYSNYNHVLLDQVAMATGTSISIFHQRENKFLYVSPNSDIWSGIPVDTLRATRPTDLLNVVAIEDKQAVANASTEAMLRLFALEKTEIRKFRYVLDYNLSHINGTSKRALVHTKPIGFNSDGFPEVFMTIACPISHLKTDQTVMAMQVMDGKWFEIHYYKPDGEKLPEIGFLTEREAQVLNLLSLSLDSQAIAEKLSLSVHTVATHRRNILQKFKLNDTVSVVSYCRLCGI